MKFNIVIIALVGILFYALYDLYTSSLDVKDRLEQQVKITETQDVLLLDKTSTILDLTAQLNRNIEELEQYEKFLQDKDKVIGQYREIQLTLMHKLSEVDDESKNYLETTIPTDISNVVNWVSDEARSD